MSSFLPRCLLAVAALLPVGSVAARADERIDYVRAVKPIFAARCYACHGALQQKAGLRLDTVALMKKGGDSGAVIVPGASAKSLLLAHISASNGARRMPPRSEGEGLQKSEIARIKAWLDQGAGGPPDEKPETDPRDHWAFKPPVRPPLPSVTNAAWVGNPIDSFIAAGHDKQGLRPRGPADRRLLLRRVYLDLIGLPPTREEQSAFLADRSPDAYEKVVERLLASKHHGERWGRHWMDVWRYSDWWGLGAEVRNSQKHIWHWRDWIIESLAADKGYDRMVREMIAADELYPTDTDRLRASGFLARSYFKFNRNTWLEEVVEHTSKAFLGLTMNCSKCHDHKFDPISQQDFYRFRAFFEPYQVRTDMVPGEVDFEKAGIPRVFDCNLASPTYLFVRGDERQPRKSKPLAPGLPAILLRGPLDIRSVALPAEAHHPGLRAVVLDNHLRLAQRQIAAARDALERARQTLADIEKKSKAVAREAKPEAPAKGTPAIRDDFGKANPDRWEMKAGRWLYRDKKLLQQQDGPTARAVLRLKPAMPTDFQARFKFTPTGGQTWKSVGLAFDVAPGNEILVYLSAYSGGPKLQISYDRGAGPVYPGEGTQARPIKLNEPQDVTVSVRGPIVNVAVNGKHALAYRLPLPRRNGSMELITYDARAEFAVFELTALPASVKLVSPGGPTAAPQTVEQARLAVVIAEKALAGASLQPELAKARFAADRARYAQPPAANAQELAQKAARAERQVAVVGAEAAIARAELEATLAPDRTKAGVTKKLAASRAALTAARKALEAPGETYTSLRGSLKTLESNLETEASRNRPFPTTSSGRRSALARWLTDARNPLTARVAVNHIWARHFGKPLVSTVFDFGRKGAAPTHPELLDWLAIELRESGWSMKHLHRLIVTSNTYRMTSSSAAADQNRKLDPENRLYWRMNPVRMQAQVIRDSLLYLSGELDSTMGGPSVPAGQSSRRRSLYFVHSHNEHNKFLSMFDDASVLECYRRAESIIPQQALTLQNSALALSAAEKVAARLSTLERASGPAFVRAAFELVLGCSPTPQEQTACEEALKELLDLATREKHPQPRQRARNTLVHALLNHNDFVTVR